MCVLLPRLQVVIPYLNLAVESWRVGDASTGTSAAPAKPAKASTASKSRPTTDDDDDNDADGGEEDEDDDDDDGAGESSAAWRAKMGVKSMKAGTPTSSAAATDATDDGGDDDDEEQQSGVELVPKTSQSRMMCDALAVLVVATFKINVRPGTQHVLAVVRVCADVMSRPLTSAPL